MAGRIDNTGNFLVDEKVAAVWSTMPQYKKKLEESINIIKDTLKLCNAPMVSFSCGKDSSVLAHLILSIDPKIPLRFLTVAETRLLHNVDTIIDWFKNNINATVDEINIDRVFSKEWKNATWEEQKKAGDNDFQLLDKGYDCIFLGLRAEESKGRKITLYMHQTDNYPKFAYKYAENSKMFGKMRSCPIAKWTSTDVLAYIKQNKMPVLDWYKEYGIEARTTARIRRSATQHNLIFWIKKKNIETYNELVDRFPEFSLLV